MTTFTVDSATALTATLPFAQSGDTILLASGTYDAISIKNLSFSGLTITSADMFRPAYVNGLTVTGSSGITFSNLEVRAPADPSGSTYAVNILSGSSNINLDHLNVHGSMDSDPSNDGNGVMVRTSSGVSITNSEFQQLDNGIAHLDSNNITFSHNSFHDLREDGIRGGGSSNVTVSHNTFSDFYPGPLTHGDAVQFWTTNTTASAHDITVTDNAFIRGAGGVAQGIFFRDEAGGMPFLHVTISNNLIAGGMFNGITMGRGQDVTITNNVVQGFSDMKSWIRIDNSDGVVVTGNSENTFVTTNDTGLVMTNNTALPLASDSGVGALASWQAQQLSASLAQSGNPAAAITAATDAGERIAGTVGNDLIFGGSGNDIIATSIGADTVNGKQGDDTITGGPGLDWLYGGQGNDLITTGSATTMVFGNLGNDTLNAGAGADTIRAGQGDDVVSAGGGNDWISGDRGSDTLTGGAGADTFHGFSGAGLDLVTDFNAAEGDHVQLDPGTTYSLRQSGADTIVDMGAGDQLVLQHTVLSSLPPGWIIVG
jgi:Ca2+-binding RTX toxin-like protein